MRTAIQRWGTVSSVLGCALGLIVLATPSASAQDPAASPPAAAKPTEPKPSETKPTDAKPEPPKWDVNAPPGPMREVSIDVTQGTWMNVDVSPDGAEIVFDLLGDLYTLPISGGEAKALTSGMAWDMQPRYSPDGKRIAFTSDRGGGDNIWVINRDGSSPVQVTKESFRLLNSPVWSPDGQYIAAHKHFSSRRSLGAGEIWLYHRTGSEGLQMTTRPTEEKDVGEPAFSPDGKYVYYSLDATGGATFEYNKDSNKSIYAIDRLDRVTGQTERYISGPGGACRPTPSPDGKSIAFIRRVRFKTCLFVQDLASTKPRLLTDSLDRDMQETWAIHGVYPTMAWTPDSRSIVYWSGGGIHRIDAATAGISDIPFHIKSTRRVSEPVRFAVEVSPDEFDVKMLQSVTVSPAGDQVAYQALGHIYVRSLPDGTPRRLTAQTDHFEFFPSYSRDGKSIVYATWNDEELGSIRIAPAAGGEGRVVTTEPGHYVDPVFTPDGKTVVFGRVSGGFLTSPLWGRDTGVWKVSAAGGEASLVSRKGIRPQFGADSDRVYLLGVEEPKDADKRTLFSVRVDGAAESTERPHLVSENAVEYRLSPDGKWVAWTERFNVYIAPFVPTGREVSIGPKAKSVPIAKVTHEAGLNLHWSGDSTTLYWSLGPELFSRKLTDAFAFLDGAPEKLPDAPAQGLNISFKAKTDVPTETVALAGARVITMHGDQVLDDATVLVNGNRIAEIGPRRSTPIPAGATVINAEGKTIIPGFIDVHAHGPQGENGITPQKNWGQYANLAFGVTTIHDPSNDTQAIFAASELARAGMIVQPRTYSTGTILYGALSPFKADIDSLDDARFHLRRMKAVGAFSVKSYNQPRREQRQQVIAAARELGMMVVPEGGSLLEHNLTMVVDGHTGIEHSLPVDRIYPDVQQLWGPTRVGYTPTLIVGYGGIMGENYWYDKTNVWENERLLKFVPRFVVDPRSRRRIKAPDEEYNTLVSAGICKSLADAHAAAHATDAPAESAAAGSDWSDWNGIQLGAHGQLAGLGAHWELWMIAGSGLSPMQALHAATIDGARYLGLDKDLGSLEPGKLADLVILDSNPLDDIHNSTSINSVMLNGRLYIARTMQRLGESPLPAPHFFFEDLQGGQGMHAFSGAGAGCAGCGLVGAGCEAPDARAEFGYR